MTTINPTSSPVKPRPTTDSSLAELRRSAPANGLSNARGNQILTERYSISIRNGVVNLRDLRTGKSIKITEDFKIDGCRIDLKAHKGNVTLDLADGTRLTLARGEDGKIKHCAVTKDNEAAVFTGLSGRGEGGRVHRNASTIEARYDDGLQISVRGDLSAFTATNKTVANPNEGNGGGINNGGGTSNGGGTNNGGTNNGGTNNGGTNNGGGSDQTRTTTPAKATEDIKESGRPGIDTKQTKEIAEYIGKHWNDGFQKTEENMNWILDQLASGNVGPEGMTMLMTYMQRLQANIDSVSALVKSMGETERGIAQRF